MSSKEEVEQLEKVRNQYEAETGNSWMVVPVTHGENGYASWEYQLWLEAKAYATTLRTAGTKKLWEEIPVSERLPDDDGYYFIKTTAGWDKVWFNKKEEWFGTNKQFQYLPTHWLSPLTLPDETEKRYMEFAEFIGKEDLKLYSEGWCQPGGSNGMHLSTTDLYNLFIQQSLK